MSSDGLDKELEGELGVSPPYTKREELLINCICNLRAELISEICRLRAELEITNDELSDCYRRQDDFDNFISSVRSLLNLP